MVEQGMLSRGRDACVGREQDPDFWWAKTIFPFPPEIHLSFYTLRELDKTSTTTFSVLPTATNSESGVSFKNQSKQSYVYGLLPLWQLTHSFPVTTLLWVSPWVAQRTPDDFLLLLLLHFEAVSDTSATEVALLPLR